MKLIQGDCLEVMKTLPDNSVDAVVTDPPYGLKFMGKKWDYNVPTVEQWQEVYRVMKPGAFLLSFGGTRTYHRMVVNIEDAGFEIRDQIQWIYGSGFPKSLDIGKAIDKAAGVEFRQAPAGGVGFMNTVDDGYHNTIHRLVKNGQSAPEAEQWDGWGTALKPANEPICLARKPLSEKTVAANVLKWGTGGLNIDGCRVEYTKDNQPIPQLAQGKTDIKTDNKMYGRNSFNESKTKSVIGGSLKGRFPANVILTYPEDEYILKENVTSTQLRSLAEWMDANP